MKKTSRNDQNPFVSKKLLNLKVKKTPSGWELRKGRANDWFLTADKRSPQPLVVYVSSFNAQIDYSYKNGYQATLGEFAGRYCRVAPLRNTRREALRDCFEFMKAHNDVRKLKSQLDVQYFAQNLATSIF